MMRHYLLVCASALLLGACSSTIEKEWECPAQKGLGCKTIKDIRSIIAPSSGSSTVAVSTAQSPNVQGGRPLNITGGPTYREDEVMRIYFSSFEDEGGNFHSPSDIYVVMENSGWVEAD